MIGTTPTNLYAVARESTSLTESIEAIAALPQGEALEAVVLMWNPQKVLVDRLIAGAFQRGSSTDQVFEARLMSDEGEMRWLQRLAGGLGTAVWLTESKDLAASLELLEGWRAVPPGAGLMVGSSVERIVATQTYLCWGEFEGSGPAEGWTTFSTRRIGAIEYPIVAAPGDRVLLKGFEYLGRGADGNARVVNERLVGFTTERQERDTNA